MESTRRNKQPRWSSKVVW